MQTGVSAWVLAMVRALQDCGVDHAALLRGLGMDPDRVGDLDHRFSQDQVTSLWVAAVAATGDAQFGLKVARHVRPSTFHVVGYAMSCSATLKRAAERFAHSARLISDSAVVDFIEGDAGYRLTVDLNTGGQPPIFQTIDTILAGFFLLCGWIQGEAITPVEVTFKHRAPADAAPYYAIFGCPVAFGHSRNSILFRAADLDRPVPSANEELAMMLDEMTSKYIAMRFASRFARKVRDVLAMRLPHGEPSKADTARLLSMTERTLLRRLRDENTTFQEVLDRLREELAFDYLRRDDLTIEKIAALLAFSSSSAFSRAFMRWTTQRPSDWREKQRRMAATDGVAAEQIRAA